MCEDWFSAEREGRQDRFLHRIRCGNIVKEEGRESRFGGSLATSTYNCPRASSHLALSLHVGKDQPHSNTHSLCVKGAQKTEKSVLR